MSPHHAPLQILLKRALYDGILSPYWIFMECYESFGKTLKVQSFKMTTMSKQDQRSHKQLFTLVLHALFPQNKNFIWMIFWMIFFATCYEKWLKFASRSKIILNYFLINLNLLKHTDSSKLLCFILKNDNNLKSYQNLFKKLSSIKCNINYNFF